MMDGEQLLSKTINFLRFPLTVAVVFIHFNIVDGFAVGGVEQGANGPGWYCFIINFLSNVAARIAVPTFYIISGFLFFYKADFSREMYVRKLKSRAMTLLVPFILWNILAVLWQMKGCLSGLSSLGSPFELKFTVERVINTFIDKSNNGSIIVTPSGTAPTEIYPYNTPLWYLRDLIVMVIISPLIYWCVKKLKLWFVAAAGVMWYLTSATFTHECYLYLFSIALFHFSIGAYFSVNRKNLILEMRRYFKYMPLVYWPLAVVDALIVDTHGAYYSYYHYAVILLGVLSAFVVASWLVEKGKSINKTLTSSSFFVFALHYLLLRQLGVVVFKVSHLPGDNYFAMLIFYFVVPALTILACVGTYMLLKRYLPRVCSLLSGGR